jgi:hypothetical protein
LRKIKDIFNSNNIADISVEVVEAGIDCFLNDGFIKELPILREVMNIYSLGKSITTGFFLKKLLKFIYESRDIPFENRVKFMSKHLNGKENEFYEKLLLIIEQIDDLKKCKVIANLFRSLVYEKLGVSIFSRLVLLVKNCFYEDLVFLNKNKDKGMLEGVEALGLFTCGLATKGVIDGGTFEEKDVDFYIDGIIINDLGKKLIEFGMYGL